SAEPRRAPVGVECDGVDPGLGKAQGKVGVEGMQPPNVRQEDETGPTAGHRDRLERREAVAVSRRQLQLAMIADVARPGWVGWTLVTGETHGFSLRSFARGRQQ